MSRAAALPATSLHRQARGVVAICAVGLPLLATLLRVFNLSNAYEIFIDEVTYSRISQNVAGHFRVSLYGKPFYLHPPGFFLLEGAWYRLLPQASGIILQVYQARALIVLVAALTTGCLFLAGYYANGWPAGAIAAGLYAADPFMIRMSSRNLLEPVTMLFALAGLTILLRAASSSGAPSQRQALLVGAFFGLALACKETVVLVTVLPLLALLFRRDILPRSRTLLILVTALAIYLLYPLSAIVTGDGPLYFSQKARGLERFVGIVQETGFNKHGSPSFLATVAQNFDTFGTTYLLLALGTASSLWLLFKPSKVNRLLVIWFASVSISLGYVVIKGALEEQLFYFQVVIALLCVGIALPQVAAQLGNGGRRKRLAAVLAAFLTVGFLLQSTLVWERVHLQPDNGYARMVAFLDSRVPPPTGIACTTETCQFLLPKHRVGTWRSIDELRSHDARFVVVSAREVYLGYGYARPDLLQWLADHGAKVFSFTGRTEGELAVYDLRSGY